MGRPRATTNRLAVGLVLATVAGACGGTSRASGASGSSGAALRVRADRDGYVVVHSAAAPGTLIADRLLMGADRELGSARRWQLLYRSSNAGGGGTTVSGLVLVPPGRAPNGGWPVIAWAHGTTGLADRCAPSLAPRLGNDPSAVREVRGLLARHFAVVATDYPGLGTPGVHPYLVGQANATAVVDMVIAARRIPAARLSRRWVTVGHSEGGQTALFVAQEARRRAPRLDFLGTVAVAPASTLEALVPLAEASHDPVEEAYAVYAIAGLGTVDPSVKVDRLLAPGAKAVLADLDGACVDAITNHLARLHVDRLFVGDEAELARVSTELGRDDDPDHAVSPAPVLITQGSTDSDVPAAATTALVTRLRALGDRVDYRLYPGLDHEGVIPASLPAVGDWIAARFGNSTVSSAAPLSPRLFAPWRSLDRSPAPASAVSSASATPLSPRLFAPWRSLDRSPAPASAVSSASATPLSPPQGTLRAGRLRWNVLPRAQVPLTRLSSTRR